MLYQFLRNNLFIIVICACGLLVIAGYKILSNTEFSNNPEIISSDAPSAQEQTVDDRNGNGKMPKTFSRRKGNFKTGHSHSIGDLPIPEISEEKKKRISALYDGYMGNDGNIGNRDPSWAKDGPPQEEIDILVEGLDNLSAAKYLKALVYHDYAREYAEKALAENPDDFETLFIWTRLRRPDEDADKVAGYRKLLEMDPNFVPALVGLGSKLKEDSPEEAIELLQKANSLDPSEGLYHLAWAYQRIGEYDKAVPMLNKAYERYNRRWMLDEIESIEAGTPQIPLIQRESQEDRQNEDDNKADKALLTEPVPPTSDESIEIETEKGAHNPFRTDLDKLNSGPPNSDAEIRAFFEQLGDAELAEFKKYLTEEFPPFLPEVLGFNKSTFYYQPKSDPSEDVLRTEIQQLAAQYPTYGYRRITKVLLRLGYTVGYKRVARLMKEENLSVSVKRVCQTTRSFEGRQPWINRVQTLEISRVDQVWVGDITYVRLKRRFIYVAVLMDIFTRMIRGWQVSPHLNTSLTLKPLQEALLQSGSPEIHHSDQGVQYLSTAYLSTLKEHGIEISLARRGHPWENGYAERLIRTLKEEEVHLNDYEDITEARERIGHFITQVYHQKRPHSALGYLTPVEFQRQTLS